MKKWHVDVFYFFCGEKRRKKIFFKKKNGIWFLDTGVMGHERIVHDHIDHMVYDAKTRDHANHRATIWHQVFPTNKTQLFPFLLFGKQRPTTFLTWCSKRALNNFFCSWKKKVRLKKTKKNCGAKMGFCPNPFCQTKMVRKTGDRHILWVDDGAQYKIRFA